MQSESEITNDRRNLDPAAEAVSAMYLYGHEYAAQRGGSMDFWDSLSASKKRICTEMVSKIKSAHRVDQ